MNGWDDLLRDALDALGEGAYHARAKEEISNREDPKPKHEVLSGQPLTTSVVGTSATDKPPELDDLGLTTALACIERIFGGGQVSVIPRPGYDDHLLDGGLDDFRAALDQLDRDTCKGHPCQAGHRCRRHTRRKRT